MEDLDPTPWPTAGATPLEVKAGALVVFHGLLPHYSAPNRSASSIGISQDRSSLL